MGQKNPFLIAFAKLISFFLQAVTNSTSGGTAEQIKYLVSVGCIPPMCDLLTVMESNIVQVALNGLENILKSGEQCYQKPNPYAVLIEECYGMTEEVLFLGFFNCSVVF